MQLIFLSHTATAQDRFLAGWRAVQAVDSADAMPPFDVSGIYREVYGQVRFLGWDLEKSATQDSMLAGLPVRYGMSRRLLVVDTVAHVDGIYLLAWKVERIKSYFHRGDDPHLDSATAIIRHALMAASYRDTANHSFWRLFTFGSNDSLHEWSDSPLPDDMKLDRVPRNRDIYAYVRRQFIHAGNEICPPFFCAVGFDAGDSGRILDGAVRANTWKSVTGEAPTIFFPNGK
ncbi:MAG TPA: hypothetical protein VHI13_07445 [Candidatus Kapabacteria bacterium]|nr:hypothetical protein [Candidatus Kapabacteria bacterium]